MLPEQERLAQPIQCPSASKNGHANSLHAAILFPTVNGKARFIRLAILIEVALEAVPVA